MTTEEILLQVKKVLGASISDLSEMLGVSCSTAYSYLSGDEPSALLMERVLLLQRTIETIGKLGLPVPCSTILKRRDGRGKTFKELLAHDELNDELNDELVHIFCQGELQQRELTKQRLSAIPASFSHRKSFNHEAFSIPAHLK